MISQDKPPSRWLAWLRVFSVPQVDIALAVVVTLAGLGVFAYSVFRTNERAGFAFLQDIEQSSLDLRFGVRGQRAHDNRIAIVGIDERTLQKIGSFPLPRKSYALLIDRLHAGGARVIAFDATFPTPETNSAAPALERLQSELGSSATPAVTEKIKELEAASDQDALFADSMKQAGNVVLGHLFLDADAAKHADPKLEAEYFNIVWAKDYPQDIALKSRDGRPYDLGQAWIANGGTVAAGAEANIKELADAAASYGFIDINPDPDGTLRHALLAIRYQNQDFFPSLALQVVREYEKIPDQDIELDFASNGLEQIKFGRHLLRPSHDGTAIINYAGPYGTYAHYSMWDVMSGTVSPETFKDKIVLVGATAKAIGDIRNTPFQVGGDPYMGVEIHANIIDNVLHDQERGRSFLTRGFDEEMIDIGFILIFGLAFGFLFSRVPPLYSTILVLLGLAGFAWYVYFSFAQQGRWLSFVIPAGTLVANYAAITSYRMIFEERAKRTIRKSFSQVVPPAVIALIEKDPQKYLRPGGELMELTVLFSDIRGFTTISEGLTPDALVLLLNEYLTTMTETLFSTYGTLDKYIGDAVMAFWGAPVPLEDHAFRACSCALRMVSELAKLNAKWESEGRPPIAIGIGLNTGEVNFCRMGSARRLAWTVMGDNVNLASRLEGITKQYQIQVVISESTYNAVAGKFVCRELDKIKVKGKHHPVNIYELLDVASERAKYDSLLTQFESAMAAYRGQNWQEAAAQFGQLLGSFPEDGPTRVFLQRALEYLENAPESDWDGVYIMKSK
jgi:adenylate cyclase